MNIGRKIAINSLLHIGGKLIASVLAVIAIAMITRYLGQDGFGQFTTITAFAMFFAILGSFGLHVVTAQMLSEQKYDQSTVLGNILTMRIVISFTVLAIAPVLALLFPYNTTIKTGISIAIFSYFFISLYETLVGFFQQRLMMHYVLIADLIDRTVLISGIYLVIQANLGILAIVMAVIAANLTSFLFLLFVARSYITFSITLQKDVWIEILKKAWPLALTISLNLLYLRTDTLLLSIFQPQTHVGIYGAAYKVIDVLTIFPMIFAGLVLPILTQEIHHKDRFAKIFQKSFDVLCIAAIPLLIGGYFLNTGIMTVIAGEQFATSGAVLRLLLFAIVAIYMNTMFSYGLISMNKQKYSIPGYVLAAVVGITGYLIFIPRFSYFGAASITIVTEMIVALYTVYVFHKHTGIFPSLKAFLPIALATTAMGLYLFAVTSHIMTFTAISLLLTILGGIIVYFIVLFAIWTDGYGEIKDMILAKR